MGQEDEEQLVSSRSDEGAQDLESQSVRRRATTQDQQDEVNETASIPYPSSEQKKINSHNYMGTLTGVFSPVSLSMFSSLLFLRVGYIVGNAGGLTSILLLLLGYGILGLTILSICAIATNGAVEGGGVYFMISRTLGPELGGSIGILFWAANTVGSALFATGCTEAIMTSLGPDGIIAQFIHSDDPWIEFGINIAILTSVTAIALVGSILFGKFIFIFLSLVIVCTFSVFVSFMGLIGTRSFVQVYNETTVSNCTVNCTYQVTEGIFSGLIHRSKSNISANFTPVFEDGLGVTLGRDCHDRDTPVTIFTVFGVLFSGVTGILAGANLSGELKNPSKAIPSGTISGTCFTFFIYLGLFVLTALTCNRELLYHECFYMYYMDFWGPFVAIGTACATLCASLSCLLGASRVLNAVAKDNMLGKKFKAFNRDINGNPVVAVLVTSFTIILLFFFGSLNAIAQLCSVLYLLSYAAVNASCFFLDAFSSPNFRPSFKYFHSTASFVGMLLDFIAMFALNYTYALASLVVCFLITGLLGIFSPAVHENNWGSIFQNFLLHQVRKYLLKLDPRKEHVKYWRPHVILLSANPRYDYPVLNFVNAMKKGGLYVIGHVAKPDEEEPGISRWLDLIDHMRIKAFVEVTVAKSYREGIPHLVRLSGVGALKPNTTVVGFHDPQRPRRDWFEEDKFNSTFPCHFDSDLVENEAGKVEYVGMIRDLLKIGKNLCVHRNFDRLPRTDPNPHPGDWWKNFFVKIARSALGAERRNLGSWKKRKNLDVWLIDFFSEPSTILQDRKSLFMVQMAYIVSISHGWKNKLKLRFFIRVMSEDEEPAILGRLKHILREERIKADVISVKFNEVYTIIEESDAVYQRNSTEPKDLEKRLNILKIPFHYMNTCNKVILDVSENTAVAFLYLPAPEPGEDKDLAIRYLDLLSEMTKNLPPTVMIHGMHAVTCTAL